MRSLFPCARSWVLPAVVLDALAGCDRSPTEPFEMPFEAAKGGGGSGSGKPGLVERIAFASDHQGFTDAAGQNQHVFSPYSGQIKAGADFVHRRAGEGFQIGSQS